MSLRWIRGIIRCMIKIYRMWRYVRLVERTFFNDNPGKTRKHSPDCLVEFCLLKTIFRRNYKPSEALKAHYMAHMLGYIDAPGGGLPKKGESISVSGEGLLFTAYSSLFEAEAKSILSIGSLATVFIAVAALVVSVLAYRANH
jgi:hypothetical protein